MFTNNYKTLAHKNLEPVADSCDVPSKMIILAVVVNCASRDVVKAVFEMYFRPGNSRALHQEFVLM